MRRDDEGKQMAMKAFHIFTLVPEAFEWFVKQHPVYGALETGSVSITLHDLRRFGRLPHHEVDDTPYGGGPGMVTRVDVVADALEGVFDEPAFRVKESREVYVLSAGGRPFDQRMAVELSKGERDVVLLCGRFEGFDARVEELLATSSLSIGPYVLAGGELAASVVMEAVIRHLPGALGNSESVAEESFSPGLEGMSEYPHYTRPREYGGLKVPSALLSGDHGAITRWRREHARPSSWGPVGAHDTESKGNTDEVEKETG